MTDSRLESFVGLGTSGTRPPSLSLPSACAGFRYETDTGLWVWDGSSWLNLTGTGVGASGISELTGDVTAGPGSGSVAATIANLAVTTGKLAASAVTNAKMAAMATLTFKANATGGSTAPQDVSAAAVAAIIGLYLPGNQFVVTLTKTADYAVTGADSGTRFNNIGASGAINLTLPTPVNGYRFGAVVFTSEYVKLTADGSTVIGQGANVSGSGGYVRSNVPYSLIELEAHDNTAWVVASETGEWSLDS